MLEHRRSSQTPTVGTVQNTLAIDPQRGGSTPCGGEYRQNAAESQKLLVVAHRAHGHLHHETIA